MRPGCVRRRAPRRCPVSGRTGSSRSRARPRLEARSGRATTATAWPAPRGGRSARPARTGRRWRRGRTFRARRSRRTGSRGDGPRRPRGPVAPARSRGGPQQPRAIRQAPGASSCWVSCEGGTGRVRPSGAPVPARLHRRPSMTMRLELAESPAVVAGLLASARAPLARVADEVRRRGTRFVVIAARGTSDHAATYAQYVLGARNGLPVGLATPSLSSLYRNGPRVGDALVIGMSQSGRSPDIVAVLDDARSQGALTLAITNDPGSPLAVVADVVVPLEAGPELAVAATKTYVAQLAVVALLSEALRGGDPDPALARLPVALAGIIELEARIVGLAGRLAPAPACVVLARGFQYATAREWALKLKEVAGVFADPYSAVDFEHGPISLVEPGLPVLAVVSSGPTLPGLVTLLGRLAADGADLMDVSDAAGARALASGSLALPGDLPEWLAPIVAILPCQLFAYHLAVARGRDPETPRHLRKVTLTR